MSRAPVVVVLLAALALLVAGCAARSERAMPAEGARATAIRQFTEAYNRHDIDAMLAMIDPDFVWFTVDGDKVGEDMRGPEALRAWLVGYFEKFPEARSTMMSISAGADFASTYECAHYNNLAGQPKTQCAVSVYGFAGPLIRRVWYFPSEASPP
jgi:hypothetical protein